MRTNWSPGIKICKPSEAKIDILYFVLKLEIQSFFNKQLWEEAFSISNNVKKLFLRIFLITNLPKILVTFLKFYSPTLITLSKKLYLSVFAKIALFSI